ncbi:hypothetical protein Xcel_0799 [Xylanimonas cellulosilytica DSM 15894]|uniref:Uncharacterized protein n=1 Tax=Xylanimonas cellulosilytica (strain DSM 15894 / JCM 12276 / CECT 5975 / KCTC 9989 / LMG 20990 / NBRC 107835 / XIL07) TaxID=446471 RepID=D1BXM7_XYLCX|nr:hypothetical protein [Xylanimonas cellulosilytica]ACZ29837.1 hypothetical protein Xcel_0799 [Xylanimonas cellulosilytica DSM 15894]
MAAFGLAVAASGWWLLAPIYQPETTCSGGGSSTGASWETCEAPSSMAAAGAWGYIVWFVVIPVVLAGLPLVARGRAWSVLSAVSAAGLVIVVLTGGISFGLPLVPGAACAVVGAVLRNRRHVVGPTV